MAPMKAMKGAAKGMTASAAYSAVAETTGLKAKDVKGVMEGIVAVAAGELKKNGAFKLAGALNLKLKKKRKVKTKFEIYFPPPSDSQTPKPWFFGMAKQHGICTFELSRNACHIIVQRS